MVFSVHFKMHVLCVSNRHQGTQAWRLWRAVTGRCWFLRTFEYACSLRLKPPSGHAGVAPLARSHKPRCVPPYIRICMFSASQAALRARRRGAFGAQSQAEVCFSAHSNMHVLCVSSHSQGTQPWRLWRAVGFSVHSNMHVFCVSSHSQGTLAGRFWRAVTSRCECLRKFR